MPHSIAAYLADIIEACDAIEAVLTGIDLQTYESQRAVRSAVEREFILIGEAVGGIRRLEPQIAEGITNARIIVGLRNILTHDYAAVDDETVYDTALTDLPQLRSECVNLLDAYGGAD